MKLIKEEKTRKVRMKDSHATQIETATKIERHGHFLYVINSATLVDF